MKFHVILKTKATDSAELREEISRFAQTVDAFTVDGEWGECPKDHGFHRSCVVLQALPMEDGHLRSALWSHVDDEESPVLSFTNE